MEKQSTHGITTQEIATEMSLMHKEILELEQDNRELAALVVALTQYIKQQLDTKE